MWHCSLIICAVLDKVLPCKVYEHDFDLRKMCYKWDECCLMVCDYVYRYRTRCFILMQNNGLPLKQEWEMQHRVYRWEDWSTWRTSLIVFSPLILQKKCCKVIEKAHYLRSHCWSVCSCLCKREEPVFCVRSPDCAVGVLCRAGGTPRTARWSRCGPRWCPTITCRARRAPWPRPSRAPSERPRSTSATAPTGTAPAWTGTAPAWGTRGSSASAPPSAGKPLIHPGDCQPHWREESEH